MSDSIYNRYEVSMELEDGPVEIEVTALDANHAEDIAINQYFGLVRTVYDVELLGAE